MGQTLQVVQHIPALVVPKGNPAQISQHHQSKQKLRQEILALHKRWQIPMMLVTHDEEEATLLGDIIISLSKGQVVSRQ